MKWIKWSLAGIGALILLSLLTIVSVLATFDPNAWKEQITTAAKEQTGRDLAIPGEISVSWFPWLGFETGAVTLGNAPGFSEPVFASVEHVKVKVEVLPLFRGAISVDVIELDGVSARLHKKKDGSSNWDDLAGSPSAGQPQQQSAGGPSSAPPIAALAVGGLQLSNASVEFTDDAAGQRITVDDLGLTTSRIELGKPFDLSLQGNIALAEPALKVALELSAELVANLDTQTYSVRDLDLSTDLNGEVVPGGALKVALKGGVDADLRQQRITLNDLAVEAAEIVATMAGQVTQFDKTPRFDVNLVIAEFDARSLMQTLAIEAPPTADPQVLRKVSVQAQVSGTPSALDLEQLAIVLDDTQINSSGSVKLSADRPLPQLRLDTHISAIDLDRYLPAPAPEEAASETSGGEPVDNTPIGIPVELLRELDARAELKIDQVTVKALNASDIALTLVVKDGVARLEPLNLALYEGLFKGRTIVNVRNEQPRFQVDAQLAGVQAGPLLRDFMGDDKVHGKTDATLAITTTGDTVGALKRALNGTVKLSFLNGAVKGFNLAESLRQAEAKLNKRDYQSEGDRPTDFSAMTMSGTFRNGVLHTDDLDMRAPLLRAAGKGEVDIAAENLNYLATVTITDEKTGQGGAAGEELQGLPIPIRIKGSFAEPTVKMELAKALGARAKSELKAAADKEKARLKAEAEAEKAKLAAKLEAEKAAARAEAEERKKKAAEKLKEKAKDKLKNLLQ